MADDAEPKDLFGDPWTPPRDPRGRKRHRRTPQLAEKVAVLTATGSTVTEIALRIGLSLPTLRKYYFRELEEGAVLARQVLNESMWAKALDGSVAAARYIRDELERGVVVGAAYGKAPAARTDEAVPSPAERKGKKALRQEAAEQIGGMFAPGPPPAKRTSH